MYKVFFRQKLQSHHKLFERPHFLLLNCLYYWPIPNRRPIDAKQPFVPRHQMVRIIYSPNRWRSFECFRWHRQWRYHNLRRVLSPPKCHPFKKQLIYFFFVFLCWKKNDKKINYTWVILAGLKCIPEEPHALINEEIIIIIHCFWFYNVKWKPIG